MSNTPQLTGLGGLNVSHPSPDIGLAWYYPALLRPSMHTQANLVFHVFMAASGIITCWQDSGKKPGKPILPSGSIISIMEVYPKQICVVADTVISGTVYNQFGLSLTLRDYFGKGW